MLYEVVFTIKRARGCCPPVQEVVKFHACGTITDLFWKHVRRIVDRRDTVHPLVRKWARGKRNLGITINVYQEGCGKEKRWTYGIRV